MEINYDLIPLKKKIVRKFTIKNAFYIKPDANKKASKVDKGSRKNNYFGSHLFAREEENDVE